MTKYLPPARHRARASGPGRVNCRLVRPLPHHQGPDVHQLLRHQRDRQLRSRAGKPLRDRARGAGCRGRRDLVGIGAAHRRARHAPWQSGRVRGGGRVRVRSRNYRPLRSALSRLRVVLHHREDVPPVHDDVRVGDRHLPRNRRDLDVAERPAVASRAGPQIGGHDAGSGGACVDLPGWLGVARRVLPAGRRAGGGGFGRRLHPTYRNDRAGSAC